MWRFRSALLALAPLLLLCSPLPAAAEERPETGRLPVDPAVERPAGLVPLYVAFAGMQALDAHSTFRGIARGGHESNPFMRGMSDSPAAFLAVKAGATAGTIYLTEKLWKRNRKAAIATMIGATIAYGFVVSHNYSVAGRTP
jgi:hypothetical protein